MPKNSRVYLTYIKPFHQIRKYSASSLDRHRHMRNVTTGSREEGTSVKIRSRFIWFPIFSLSRGSVGVSHFLPSLNLIHCAVVFFLFRSDLQLDLGAIESLAVDFIVSSEY
jgi:hypothetical protein